MITLVGSLLAGGGGLLLLVGLSFGFAPGLLAKVIAVAYPPKDPRRAEMIAEVYAIPYKERRLWVFEQAERALTEGVPARIRRLRMPKDGYLTVVTADGDSYKIPYKRRLTGGRYFPVPGQTAKRRSQSWSIASFSVRDRLIYVELRPKDVCVVGYAHELNELKRTEGDSPITVRDSADR